MKTRNQLKEEKTFNLLIGVTGSIAAIKLVELTKKIKSFFPRPYQNTSNGTSCKAELNIRIVLTENSKHFVPKKDLIKSLDDLTIIIHDDQDEWDCWKKMTDPVLHIELRKWAHMCLIAPLDANTMAKMANGLCDNLLTCVIRAWDVSKPLVYCPAMNVHMYNHPLTRDHLCKLQSFGYLRIDCVEKRLACGDFGMGGMASVDSIANKVLDCLTRPQLRKVSLTRPILDKQPTYPIISTCDDGEGSTNGTTNIRITTSPRNQLLNRCKSNNSITIHQVQPKPNTNANDTSNRNSIATNGTVSLLSKRRSIPSLDELAETLRNDKRLRSESETNRVMSGVTSVQNLKTYSNDRVVGTNHNNSNLANDEEPGFEFDPSKLLEQTMVTDEFVPEEFSNSKTVTDPFGEETPVFNTSKFLTSCFNKERGCFTCAICKHDYKNRKSMARHFKEQHVQGNIYHCKPCGVSYKRREKLIKHNRERHPGL